MNRILILSMVSVTLLASACSDDPASTITGVPWSNDRVVTGAVSRIVDGVPVDGGVDVDIRLDGGKSIVAYLTSFFTGEPAPPDKIDAYEVIRTLEPGNRVRVRGELTDYGIRIKTISRLAR